MPTNKPTLRELNFVNEYLKGKSPRQAALKAYNCKRPENASAMATKVLSRPHIQKMIASQAHIAIDDMVKMREELQKSKTDYAVRYKINADFLDRSGHGAEKSVNLTQVNIYTDEQQKRIAERILKGGNLRDRSPEGEETSD